MNCWPGTHEASKGNKWVSRDASCVIASNGFLFVPSGAFTTHTQRLEVEVKMMKSKVKQLEEALSEAQASGSRGGTDIFSPSLTTPGAFEDVEEAAESIGSFSVGPDGAGKYYGRFAGSEVRPSRLPARYPAYRLPIHPVLFASSIFHA